MNDTPTDPRRLIAALAQRGPELQLGTLDLCFVAALHVRAEGGALSSFQEEQLVDIFEQVALLVDPDSEHLRKRATHAIQRLRDQRLLARIDGAGVMRSGEYALTRLATGIVDFFLHDEALTRENLTLLTRTLHGSLREILAAARRAEETSGWQTGVVGPLRITVADLVSGIERRQRGLDLQQEEFQKEISELLQADWFGAVERCQSLLETTSETLRELNEVLLRDTHQLQNLLQDIQELAIAAGHGDAETATARVMEHVDRIAAWGSARQRAWSEYYQYVHRYLRDVVRLDPARALTQRLREQMVGKAGRGYALALARATPLHVLRDVVAPPERPPVKRPRAPREQTPGEDLPKDAKSELEHHVRGALEAGAAGLVEVTARVTAELPPEEHFVAAGRIAEHVARLAKVKVPRDRPWLEVQERLLIEEWQVSRAEGQR